MTPTFKPGDRVTRTGESHPDFGLIHGRNYTVHRTAREGRFLKLTGVPAEWAARGFRPADEEGKT